MAQSSITITSSPSILAQKMPQFAVGPRETERSQEQRLLRHGVEHRVSVAASLLRQRRCPV
jgi:hypothetical protein